MSRRARKHTTLFSIGLALVVLPLFFGTRVFPRYFSMLMPATLPPPAGFDVILIRSGLDAPALAAAGVTSNSVSSALQEVADDILAAPSALSSADAAFASARVTKEALERKIQVGKASAEEVAAYPGAKTALDNATATRVAILDGYFASATAGLTAGQRTAVTKIRANRSWELPLEFLVVDREQGQWVALRDALANERIAVELPDHLSAESQASLATWRSDAAVASAKASLDANLASVTSAWTSSAGSN